MTGYTADTPREWRQKGGTLSKKLATEFGLIATLTDGIDKTATVMTLTEDTITLAGATKINLDGNTEVDGFFNMGEQGTGIAVTTANPYVMEIHAKTASNLTAGDSGLSCGIRCRYEVGFDQSNQISMIALEGRLRPKKDLGDGCHAGVSGTIEASEGAACVLGGTSTTQRNAGNFCVELGENVTCTSGWLTGVTIDSSTHSGVSMASCTYAGMRIKTSSGKEVWEHGIYLDDDSTTTGFTLGACTTGIALTGAMTTSIAITGSATTGVSIATGLYQYPISMDSIGGTTADYSSGAYGNVIKQKMTSGTLSVTAAGALIKGYFEGGTTGSNKETCGMIVYLKAKSTLGAAGIYSVADFHVHSSSDKTVAHHLRLFGDVTSSIDVSGGTVTDILDLTDATAITNLLKTNSGKVATKKGSGNYTFTNSQVRLEIDVDGTTFYVPGFTGAS